MSQVLTGSALASSTILLNATDRGHYTSSGFHDPQNINYIVGNPSTGFRRNFFIFDLFSVHETIVSAELHLLNPVAGFFSNDGSEVYSLSKVSTEPFVLMQGGANQTAIYDDLASELIYGNYVSTTADNMTTIVVPLTAAAVADINSTNQFWTVGGSISTLDGDDQTVEALFRGSGANPGGDMSQTRLVLTVIPAPGALLPLLAGTLLPIRSRRRYA